MLCRDLSFFKTLNPSLSLFTFSSRKPSLHQIFPNRLAIKSVFTPSSDSAFPQPITTVNHDTLGTINMHRGRDVRTFAGRSKKKPGGRSSGRIEGNAEVRRQAKRNARVRSKKMAESLFYRLKNPSKNYPDNFTEEELEMIGLGYDRMVRFMDKDDPNLRHPYDWYKYGEFGPYSWRGVVVGDPVRGGISDECVSMMGEVKNIEEWEKIEQHEMATDFGKRLEQMDRTIGFRHFWVFVRHPRWRLNEKPWQQWTMVCEVVLEAGKQRLDKWSLMGRLGNKTRSLITQCAAWFRPDIIYVKKPVFQCRFEPQDAFFNALVPYLDPETEKDFMFEFSDEEGRVEMCTYFGGLCKMVKVSPKAFVDDVVNAYQKLSDEKKSKCLEFLLSNHPVELLHPYTKEWKAKLEEMELGCDAPDDDEDIGIVKETGDAEFTDWIEDDGDGMYGYDDYEDDAVRDMEGTGDDGFQTEEEEDTDAEESENYWEEEFRKAVSSSDRMEKLVKKSIEISDAIYEEQLDVMDAEADENTRKTSENMTEDGDETTLRSTRAKVSPEEWKRLGYGKWRKRIRKSKIPPELFLRAAVRPFTYRNLVKEIVLTRHAILEGEIGKKDD